MSWFVLADAAPTDIVSWFVWALVGLCATIAAMATWYARVKEPAFSKQITDILIDSAKMLKEDRRDSIQRQDAREAAHDAEIAAQRQECRTERAEMLRQWSEDVAADRKQRNEDNAMLRTSLGVLSDAVNQLQQRTQPRRPNSAAGT